MLAVIVLLAALVDHGESGAALPDGRGTGQALLSADTGALPQATPDVVRGGQDDLAAAPRITLHDFKALLCTGRVIVIDVRGDVAYRQGHIAGARSVPLDALDAHAAELRAAGRPIVAYCS